jgi:hypothetical protein
MRLKTPLLITFFFSVFILTAGGSLIGRYRYDEIWFLHNSWAALYKQIELFYTPPTLSYILKQYWSVIDGDISKLWQLRIVALCFVFTQAACVFYLTAQLYLRNNFTKLFVSSLTTLVFLTLSVNYRGFEIRPEIIPNTALLLAAVTLFYLLTDSVSEVLGRTLLLITLALLLLSSLISIRHILPNLFIFGTLLLVAVTCNKLFTDKQWKIFYSIATGLLLTLVLVALIYREPLLNLISETIKFQLDRTSRTWIDKLIIGGSISQLYARGVILAVSFAILAICRNRIYVNFGLLLSIASFYTFLLIVDVRPFEYIRSIEWTLLLILSLYALRELNINLRDTYHYISRSDKVVLFFICITVLILFYYICIGALAYSSIKPWGDQFNKVTVLILIFFFVFSGIGMIHTLTPKLYVSRLFTYLNIFSFLVCIPLFFLTEHIRYTQILLLLLLSGIVISVFPARINLNRVRFIAFFFITVGFLSTYFESVKNLSQNENTIKTIHALIKSRSITQLEAVSPKQFGEIMMNSISIFDQISSRRLYCSWFPNGRAIVYMWSHHPICLQDSDSYTLSLLHEDSAHSQLNMDLTKYDFISLPHFKPEWATSVPSTYVQIENFVWMNYLEKK